MEISNTSLERQLPNAAVYICLKLFSKTVTWYKPMETYFKRKCCHCAGEGERKCCHCAGEGERKCCHCAGEGGGEKMLSLSRWGRRKCCHCAGKGRERKCCHCAGGREVERKWISKTCIICQLNFKLKLNFLTRS